jgi:hypothetical protein
MRIRSGRLTPVPQWAGPSHGAAAGSPFIRSGRAAPGHEPKLVARITLAQPELSAEQVEETVILFHAVLEHLDGLGLGEAATHVSLGFERFRATHWQFMDDDDR